MAGRATTISIRGLAGDFSTTLLNGREQVSSGDNRGVEFDQYPSELLNQVVVYKTPDANLVAQGISGTVDLQTVRPLSFGKRVVALNGRYEKNSVGEVNPGYDDTGYRFSASYIDQFADNTIGIALGFARLDSPGQAERWNAWGYPTDTVAGQANTRILGGTESFATSTSNVRDGLMAVVDTAGERRKVSLILMHEDVAVGDYVLIQQGSFAFERLDAERARESLALMEEVFSQGPADVRAW